MALWKFFCYDTADGIDLWRAWYDSQDKATQANHDIALEFLESRLQHEWIGTPHFGPLVPAEGIYEIRLPGKVKHRVLVYFGPGERELTVVLPCYHKGRNYTPRKAPKTAVKRKKDIESGKRKRISCERPQ